jgi:hypothetical protein
MLRRRRSGAWSYTNGEVIYDRSITMRFASEHPHWTTVEHCAVGIVTSLLT